jgi:hypothetical protein
MIREGGIIAVSIVVTGGFVALLLFWALHPPSEHPSELLIAMTGVLGSNFTVVVSYWMGTSASSKAKDDALAAAAKGATNGSAPPKAS